MRCYNEPIEVRLGLVNQVEGPAQFLWRNRLWMVRAIQTRWIETGAWWDSSTARALRGENTRAGSFRQATSSEGSGSVDVLDGDVLAEEEVWRVEAGDGRTGYQGVYELAHAWGTGQWRLRSVMD